MITLAFRTNRYTPDDTAVDLRTDVDGWEAAPLPGRYDAGAGAWTWSLDFARYAGGFQGKFFAEHFGWQKDPNLVFAPADAPTAGAATLVDGKTYFFTADTVAFPPARGPLVERGWVQRTLFPPTADPDTIYDVIVIGSGMGGGTLADHLADSGLSVLVIEAGGYCFPTHIGNLPRPQSTPGAFSKHIWALWDRFAAVNYESAAGSDYIGGQGFNLGGRSVFWGGFIPRMTSWELDRWPTAVKWDLEDIGYVLAEDFMGRSTAPRTIYSREIHLALRQTLGEMNHADAPVAIRQRPEGANTLGSGIFSTADVLMESLLTNTKAGNRDLRLLLNHQVVEVRPDAPARVVARDLAHGREVSFTARRVVLCAGCIESARLVKRSPGLPDPGGLVGKGMSDHPIYFTHFRIPRASPYFDPTGNVKTLSQPKEGQDPARRAPFNLLLEIGSDLNHGRYIDEDVFDEEMKARRDYMLCEIVFLCNEDLNENNRLTFTGVDARPVVDVRRYDRPDLLALTDGYKWRLLRELGAQPIDTMGTIDPVADEAGWKSSLAAGFGMPGGVAHEAGTLRMQVPARPSLGDRGAEPERPGLVDENLRFLGTEHGNVYVCDLSVFPTTPAANPSLTLVALAIRLAKHLHDELRPTV